MYILIDDDNLMYWGPFKTEADAKRYAKLNNWGPADGDGSRFGGQGWHVAPLEAPVESEDTPKLYKLTFE